MVRQLFYTLVVCLSFSLSLFAAPLSCQLSTFNPAERSFKVRCIASDLPATDKIELQFLARFAGIEGLSERVFGLQIKDEAGQRLLPEILGDGVYRLSRGRSAQITLEYEMRLARVTGASGDPGRYALTSNLNQHASFILLSDVVPRVCAVNTLVCAPAPVRLQIHLPDDWQVATTEPEIAGAFEVAEIERAVFFIGKLRRQTINVEQMNIQVALAEEVNLSEVQIAMLVEALARQQASLMRSREQGNFLVTLARFPVPLTGLRSAALTRGRSVIMLLHPDTDSGRTLRLYQKHLAHELFHFYLPEAFIARENFDWFWEGFTRYVALLTLNQLRLISLRDYLDEIGFEFEAYNANPLRGRLSLLAASPGKFASAANYELLYHKGTLVAALYDLTLRAQSEGKKTVLDVMREFYETYRQRNIGNSEVMAILRKAGKFESFVRDYIEGTREIELADHVKPMGLTVNSASGRPRLNVAKKLSVRQAALLAPLGY
jgi:predicted metalloprotease with PDZ domain